MLINVVSGFVVLTASTAQAQEVAHEPCVDWESNAAAYEEAFAKWTAPSCYTFTYAYTIAEMIKGQSQKRFVKNGQPVQMNYPYPEFETIDEFWTLIQESCIQDCPTIGAHSCKIDYATSDDGGFMFPSSIEIDFNSSSDASQDTHIYSLFNVSSVDCSGIQEMENVLCVDWESTAAGYEAAYEQWTAPSCYSFTYSFSNSTINNLETKRSVRDGVSLLSGDDGELHTLDDFWSFTTSGAYSCRVNYFMNEEGGFMYPIDLYIDMDGRIFGTDTYRIYDLRIGECPDDSSVEGEEEGQGNEETLIEEEGNGEGNEEGAAEEGQEAQGNEESAAEEGGEAQGNEEATVEEEGDMQGNPETSDSSKAKSIVPFLLILSLSIAVLN